LSDAFAVTVVIPDSVAPPVGELMLTVGDVVSGLTVKLTPLLDTPPTVTMTFPVVAPLGTAATMLLVLQLVGMTILLIS